jgi:hypothetical protein
VLRLLMIDALHAVRVPSVEAEELRDPLRAREDLRGDLMRTRQRLSKLLLHHGVLYQDSSSTWTQRQRAWLRGQDLGGGAQAMLLDYLGAVDTLELRRARLEATIAELVPGSPYGKPSPGCGACVGSTRSARSASPPRSAISPASTARTADELPRLVPCESSSGETRRQAQDHQDRLPACAPAAGRGGLALPQAPRPRGSALERRQEVSAPVEYSPPCAG